MALKSDCVIVGRCADLYPEKNTGRCGSLSMRIWKAGWQGAVRRLRKKEEMTDKELKQHILGIDKKRAKYYEFYTGHKCGDKLNFDLCVNTSGIVIKEIVPGMAAMLKR